MLLCSITHGQSLAPAVRLSPVVVGVILPLAMPDHSALVSHAVGVLAGLCGGCTISSGAGAYVMQAGPRAGEVVTEPHTRVWAYAPMSGDAAALDAALSDLAAYMLARSSEECILIEDSRGAGLWFRDADGGLA